MKIKIIPAEFKAALEGRGISSGRKFQSLGYSRAASDAIFSDKPEPSIAVDQFQEIISYLDLPINRFVEGQSLELLLDTYPLALENEDLSDRNPDTEYFLLEPASDQKITEAVNTTRGLSPCPDEDDQDLKADYDQIVKAYRRGELNYYVQNVWHATCHGDVLIANKEQLESINSRIKDLNKGEIRLQNAALKLDELLAKAKQASNADNWQYLLSSKGYRVFFKRLYRPTNITESFVGDPPDYKEVSRYEFLYQPAIPLNFLVVTDPGTEFALLGVHQKRQLVSVVEPWDHARGDVWSSEEMRNKRATAKEK